MGKIVVEFPESQFIDTKKDFLRIVVLLTLQTG